MGSTAPSPPPPPPPPPVQIRKARPSDALAVAALGAAVFRSTFENSGCTPEQLEQYLAESYSAGAIGADIADPSKTLLVAVEPARDTGSGPAGSPGGGAAVATAATEATTAIMGFALMTRGSHVHEPCVRHLAAPVELQRLYVGLGQHGRGVGRALAEAVIALARGEGFEHMWLGVWEENHRAQKIYGKLGFTRIGEHVFDVGGDLQTDEIMFKVL